MGCTNASNRVVVTQEPFDAWIMFKAILLGQWHSLPDAIPDETTLCHFRNRLEGLLGSDQ